MKEETNVIYAKKLKLLRVSHFMTQQNVADKFKITQQAYAAMEKGKINFTLQKIEKTCKIFNTPFDDFLTINLKKVKTNHKKTDSYNIKVLKKHYERLLLIKDIRIGELELENKHLKKGRKLSKKEPDIYVMI